jgi:hypothetical protein
MQRLTCQIRLTLAALALLGLAVPVGAQAPQDQVPFKVTGAGPTESFMIPVGPPILSWKDSIPTGDAPLLGQFTYVDHTIVHLGVDGKPVSCTDGIGAFTAANGDGIFLSFSGLIHPSPKPGLLLSEGIYTVTGGQGRFAGASGSGVVTMEIDPVKNMVVASWDGTISGPK